MYRVETNKYSHESSAAVRVHSRHTTLAAAIAAGRELWGGGWQRWVDVIGPDGRIHYKSGAELGDAIGAYN